MKSARFLIVAILVSTICVVGWAAGVPEPAAEDAYPSSPIKIVVPSTAGGASDVVARLFQRAVDAHLPEPFVVVNVPGAGTALGAREVATSRADGYTALMMHEAMLSASAQGRFDLGWQSLEPIALTGREAYLVVVHASSEMRGLTDLYREAAARPVRVGVNIGGLNHFTSLIVADAGGVEFQPVQYSGGADAVTALLGRHIEVIFAALSETGPYINAGDFRAIAVLSDERIPAISDVPTSLEQGYDAISELNHMWWVPKGSPPDRAEILARALQNAISNPEVTTVFANRNIQPYFLSGDELKARVSRTASTIEELVERFDLHAR